MSSELRFDFAGQVAILTGAASGMGRLFSENFARCGGSVVMCDINGEVLEQAVAEVNAIRPGSAHGVVCDVRDYQQICHARAEAVRVYGRIDVAIPFAGGAEMRMRQVPKGTEFPDVPIEVYDWSLDVNLRAQLYLDHAVTKQMREQRSGVLIHIGSITGEEGSKNNQGYSASKSGAMYGLTKSMAQYGEPYGIRCCCVAPGPVLTRPGMATMRTIAGRAAEVQEVIDLILFLVSDKGAFINGTNIMIDGGRNALTRKDYAKK